MQNIGTDEKGEEYYYYEDIESKSSKNGGCFKW